MLYRMHVPLSLRAHRVLWELRVPKTNVNSYLGSITSLASPLYIAQRLESLFVCLLLDYNYERKDWAIRPPFQWKAKPRSNGRPPYHTSVALSAGRWLTVRRKLRSDDDAIIYLRR